MLYLALLEYQPNFKSKSSANRKEHTYLKKTPKNQTKTKQQQKTTHGGETKNKRN